MNEVLYKKNVIVKTFFLGIFLALAICTPLFLKNKFVISTIINFILLLSVASIGISRSIIVCIVPSIVAIFVGMLPSILLPFIPLIMLSNILLVVIFNAFQKYSHFFALFLAALIKCSFLYSLGWVAKNLFLQIFDFQIHLFETLNYPLVFDFNFNKVIITKTIAAAEKAPII